MARQTVDLGSVSSFAKGVGNVGSGSVQYKPNPNAGSSAGMLAKSLNIALDVSQQNDRRKQEEENTRFQTEFNSYVSKALQDDNVTGIEELDTLYPDMNMTRKLLILEASGKTAIQRDEGFQSIIAGIGTQTTDDDGNTVGTPNTLDGINAGYQQAEQYIRDNNANANAPYLSGMLGYLEAQRAAQVQQFVAGKRADELSATVNQFETTDKALAAVGDWDALLARDLTWKEAGGNDFIQGKDRNAAILNASYNQALLDRDITSLRKAPEEYKGMMKGKPQLWQSYMAKVQREIDVLKAGDVDTALKADEAETKQRKAEIRKKMLNQEELTEEDGRFISLHSDLSGSRTRLLENSKTPPDISKQNLATEANALATVSSQDDLDEMGLTLEVLNDPDKLESWAMQRPDIRREDAAALIKVAIEAGRVQTVKSSNQYANFKESVEGILSPLKRTNFNDGKTLAVGSNDTIAYSTAKEFAEKEYQELVEIVVEKNGGLAPTKEQLREIKNSVTDTLKPYVDEIYKNPAVNQNPDMVSSAIETGTEKIDLLAVKIDGKSYQTLSVKESKEAMAAGKKVGRISEQKTKVNSAGQSVPNPAYYRFIILED